MATQDYNIDQTLCVSNNQGGENAICIFESLSTGEEAILSQDKIKSTQYELVCGCLLFTGTEDEDAVDPDEDDDA